MPLQQGAGTWQGHPVMQHSAVGPMPQVEQFSDPAYEGVGATIVVMSGNAMTMA
ncbi:MAG: hypothetical protein JWM21_718 [Acidobacteria bacterium]|nr:hypothetical protein [Acidobacteriota bacterium]